MPDRNSCQWKRLTGAVLCISENYRVKSEGHQITKCGQNAFLELSLYFNVPGINFFRLKGIIGAVLSISENFRSKDKKN